MERTDRPRPGILRHLWRFLKRVVLLLLLLWAGGIVVYRFVGPPITPPG